MIDDHVRASMLAAGDPAAPWPEQLEARLAAPLEELALAPYLGREEARRAARP